MKHGIRPIFGQENGKTVYAEIQLLILTEYHESSI